MNTKTIHRTIITIIFILCIIGVVEAATFGVETTVCAPSWYCTAFSEGSCGTRACIDTNVCGTNIYKPTEFLQCDESNPERSSGGGSSGYAASNALPTGYFTTNTDVIAITIDHGTVAQKIIAVNTTLSGEYYLEIRYPSSYISGTEFITTSSNNKSIEYRGDFNIIIDARSISVGTYIIPITISNKYYSKSIEVIVDVVSKESSDVEIYLDSKIKTIGEDRDIIANIRTKGITLWAGENITYTILDPTGNSLLKEDRTIIDPTDIEEKFVFPQNIEEGYYTLNVKFQAEEKEYSKSTVFTVFVPNKYSPVLETPKKGNIITNNLIWIIIIVIIAALIIINTLTSNNSSSKAAHRSWRKKLMMSKPLINISFNAREKMRDFSDRLKANKEFDEKHQLELVKKRNEILRNSYEKGFISLTEYSAAIHSQGPPTEQEKEHIRREEDRHKREAEARKAKEDRLLEEKKKEDEKKRLDEERKEEKRKEEHKKQEEKRKEEERREKEEAEEQKEREEKKKEERRKEEERREKEEKREEERRKEEEKERKESKKKEEERIAKILEKREEKLIEKIVEKLDKEENMKEESEEKHEKKKEERKREEREEEIKEKEAEEKRKEKEDRRKEKEEAEERKEQEEKHKKEDSEEHEKHEHHTEKDPKVTPTIARKSEILDKRARDEEAFVLNNNQLLYSLRDFLNVLPHMSEHVLHHHIKHGRNDFANWIGDVFRYEDIAEEVRKANTKEDIIKVLKEHE